MEKIIYEDFLTDEGFDTLINICRKMGWGTEWKRDGNLYINFPKSEKDMADWILEI